MFQLYEFVNVLEYRPRVFFGVQEFPIVFNCVKSHPLTISVTLKAHGFLSLKKVCQPFLRINPLTHFTYPNFIVKFLDLQ